MPHATYSGGGGTSHLVGDAHGRHLRFRCVEKERHGQNGGGVRIVVDGVEMRLI